MPGPRERLGGTGTGPPSAFAVFVNGVGWGLNADPCSPSWFGTGSTEMRKEAQGLSGLTGAVRGRSAAVRMTHGGV